MQAISSLFSNPVQEAPEPPQEQSWIRVSANGATAVVTSVALYAHAALVVYSGALILSGLTGIVLPAAPFLLLYPTTLLATYWVDKVSRPFFERALGIEPEVVEPQEVNQLTDSERMKELALGLIKSLAIWTLCTLGSVFAVGMGMRLILGRSCGLHLGRLFWLLIVAPVTGSYLSMIPIQQVAGSHFRKSKELIS